MVLTSTSFKPIRRRAGGSSTARPTRTGTRRRCHAGSGLCLRLPKHPSRVPRRQREPAGSSATTAPSSWTSSTRPNEGHGTRRDAVVMTSCWSAAAAPACAPPSPSPKTNPRLRVAVVSKVYPMRSHTVSAEGGAAGGRSARTTASTSTPTTPSPAATGCATRTPSRRSSRKRPRSCSGWSTGAARGAASPTATSPCGRSAA